jgi:hypothetical protein
MFDERKASAAKGLPIMKRRQEEICEVAGIGCVGVAGEM